MANTGRIEIEKKISIIKYSSQWRGIRGENKSKKKNSNPNNEQTKIKSR
jgi:hypothetical protein